MGMELVPETSIFNELTRLIAREHFINVSRCESFRSYSLQSSIDVFHQLLNTKILRLIETETDIQAEKQIKKKSKKVL
jgi:hypothetical protein